MSSKIKKLIGIGAIAIALVMNLQYALFSYADGKIAFSAPTYAETGTGGDPSDSSESGELKRYKKDTETVCEIDCSYVVGDTYYYVTVRGKENKCPKVKEVSTCDNAYACDATCPW